MKSSQLTVSIACAVLALAAGPAMSKPGNGKGPPQGVSNGRGNDTLRMADPRIRPVRGPNYGVNACPPGLAAKHNGCLPPGQAKKVFQRGQRIPRGYGFYTPLDTIPPDYRSQIPGAYLGRDYDYIYRGNDIYVVDPTTRLVTDIIALLL